MEDVVEWADNSANRAVDIKQVWHIGKQWDAEETQWGRRYRNYLHLYLLIGVAKGVLRLRFPKTTSPVRYLTDATTDLKCLAACAIAGVAPVGILADKLEEEYPHLCEEANHLRKWEQVHKERQ